MAHSVTPCNMDREQFLKFAQQPLRLGAMKPVRFKTSNQFRLAGDVFLPQLHMAFGLCQMRYELFAAHQLITSGPPISPAQTIMGGWFLRCSGPVRRIKPGRRGRPL